MVSRSFDSSIGRSVPPAHDHVCRNHNVGSTCSSASSGPRLCTVTRISTSSGVALAYSTTTSKYRPSSKMPVSISSYSGSSRPRAWLVRTRSSYGNGACGYLYNIFRYDEVGVASRWKYASFTSSPWLPSELVRPNNRSFRSASRPFHRHSARHSNCLSSLIPARPSSPHRYARERAWSWVNADHASPLLL